MLLDLTKVLLLESVQLEELTQLRFATMPHTTRDAIVMWFGIRGMRHVKLSDTWVIRMSVSFLLVFFPLSPENESSTDTVCFLLLLFLFIYIEEYKLAIIYI